MNTNLESLVGTFTLKQLSERTGRSIEAIVQFAMNGKLKAVPSPKPNNGITKAPPPSKKTKKVNAPDIGLKTRKVNVKSLKARARYDARVYKALGKQTDWTKAAELRAEVNGTPAQIRSSLQRLVDAGNVIFRGKARATEYKVK